MSTFLTNIGSVLTAAIGWVGDVVTALFDSTDGALHNLLPFIALGLGVGILGLGVKYVRSFIKIG